MFKNEIFRSFPLLFGTIYNSIVSLMLIYMDRMDVSCPCNGKNS